MRFDLEIQSDPLKLVYVESGKDIDSSLVPVLYIHTNDVNIVPSDLITVDTSTILKSLSDSPIYSASIADSKIVNVKSNKLLLTHIALYSKTTNTKFPVFYAHKLDIKKYSQDAKFIEDSVMIYTHDGSVINNDQYYIEFSNDYAYIYINPIDNLILYIQWSDSISIHNEMLKLDIIYKDKGTNFNTSELGKYDYCCTLDSNRETYTVHTGKSDGRIYYKVNNIGSFVKKPAANLEDKWYLLIENFNISASDKESIFCTYRLPEYYIQRQNDAATLIDQTSLLYKCFENQICKIINNKYIKLQMSPSLNKLDSVDIFIRDKYSKELLYAFTTNNKLINTVVNGTTIIYSKIEDYSLDGIFKLSESIDDQLYFATSTYYIDNIYYEYRQLNLKTVSLDATKMVAIFVKPTYTANDTSNIKLLYCYIGSNVNENFLFESEIGICFKNKLEYIDYIKDNSYMHIAYISMNASKLVDILDIIPCASTNISMPFLTQEEAESVSDTLFTRYVTNNSFPLYLNDTAVAVLENGILNNNNEITDDEIEYISTVKDTINKNITISTNVILNKNIVSNKISQNILIEKNEINLQDNLNFIGTDTPIIPIQ